jgi:pimeloyl-ACP methyl ester carboxylesterase
LRLGDQRKKKDLIMTTLDGFRHRSVQANGINVHAVIGGEGPALVLLHGFPQTWWEWHKMMPALAARHTVVALDLRGAGHSDSPPNGYEKVNLAADVHGVMAALGFATYAVCGHDIGAMVALALACTQRGAVTQLAVLDAPLPGWSQWEGGQSRRSEGVAHPLSHEARPAGAPAFRP